MTINYLIIIIATMISCICIYYLSKFASSLENGTDIENINDTIILSKLGELERTIKRNADNISSEKVKEKNENIFMTEIDKYACEGLSNEEIAKKTNKSVREIDLILKLKNR